MQDLEEMPSWARKDSGNVLRRALHKLENSMTVLARVAVLLMMVLISANAMARYIFNTPIPASNGIVELFLMIGLVYFSLSHVQRIDGNIRADMIYDRLSTRNQAVIDLVTLALSLGVFVLLTYLTYQQAFKLIESGAKTPGTVGLPTGYSWLIVALGATVLCLRVTVQIIDCGVAIIGGED